jgi:hypothetical protein
LENDYYHSKLNASALWIFRKDYIIAIHKTTNNASAENAKKGLKNEEAASIAERGQTHDPERLSHLVFLFLNHILQNELASNQYN